MRGRRAGQAAQAGHAPAPVAERVGAGADPGLECVALPQLTRACLVLLAQELIEQHAHRCPVRGETGVVANAGGHAECVPGERRVAPAGLFDNGSETAKRGARLAETRPAPSRRRHGR